MTREPYEKVRAVEPPPSLWAFPNDPRRIDETAGGGEVIGLGADLEPGTLLAGYRAGVFPMPARRNLMAWWSPNPRGIIPIRPESGLRVSHSLHKSCGRYEVTIDEAFVEVIGACGVRGRPGAWIDRGIRAAYEHLHRLGWAHSVEAWDYNGQLAGGLYGVSVGGLFAGESMFYRQTDASKVALVRLVEVLRTEGASLLDVQWATPHLRSLGAIAITRSEYHERLTDAIEQPQPKTFGGEGRMPDELEGSPEAPAQARGA
jgi:leucyl/phenylalanyl-tRNA---protein transferase